MIVCQNSYVASAAWRNATRRILATLGWCWMPTPILGSKWGANVFSSKAINLGVLKSIRWHQYMWGWVGVGAWRWGLGGRTAGFVGSRLGTDCYFVIDLIPGFLPDCIYTIFSRGRDLDLSIYTNIWGGERCCRKSPVYSSKPRPPLQFFNSCWYFASGIHCWGIIH